MSTSNNNQGETQRHNEAVKIHLADLKKLCNSVPIEHVSAVNTFWRGLRETLQSLEKENAKLTQDLQAAGQVVVPPPRPASSTSVQAARQAITDAIQATGDGLSETQLSNTIRSISSLPPAWVAARLNEWQTETNSLGCWMDNSAPHNKGYKKKNLVNTRFPGTSNTMIGANPYLHQLAIVAKNQASHLKSTVQSANYQVSHLCHNTGCFNPDHVVVEESRLNAVRNECKHRFIIVLPDGTTVDPCNHWNWGNAQRPSCILRKKFVAPEGRGVYNQQNAGGQLIVRTGRLNQ